jgi:hypothetical protein
MVRSLSWNWRRSCHFCGAPGSEKFPFPMCDNRGNRSTRPAFSDHSTFGGWNMRKSLFAIALVGIIATPAFAEEVGVRVGPVGAGVTVGESHDRNWDRDRDHTTVIKERAPTDRTTVIKKEDADGNRSKTVIHDNN